MKIVCDYRGGWFRFGNWRVWSGLRSGCRGGAKGGEGEFGWAVESEGDAYGSEAAVDVEL